MQKKYQLVILLAITVMFSAFASATIDSSLFSQPISSFSVSSATATIPADQTSSRLGVTIADDAIWSSAYYLGADGQWEQFTLSQSPNSTWIPHYGSAELTITSDLPASNAVIIYSCTRTGVDQWDCHGDNWQLIEFDIVQNNTNALALPGFEPASLPPLTTNQTNETNQTPPNQTIEIMMLGDSLTQEWSGREATHDVLVTQGYTFDNVGSFTGNDWTTWDSDHQGIGGRNILQVYGDMDGWTDTIQPDVINLMIGTNDVAWSHGTTAQSASSIADEYESLLDKLQADVPGVTIATSTIPPVSPSIIDQQGTDRVDLLNEFNDEITARIQNRINAGEKLTFVDVNSIVTIDYVGGDGVHLTSAGYQLLGETWADGIMEAIALHTGNSSPNVTDITAPQLDVQLTPQTLQEGDQVTIDANSSSTDVAWISISVEQTTYANCSSTSCSYTLQNLTAGNYSYEVLAQDTSANTQTQTGTIVVQAPQPYVDTEAPTANIQYSPQTPQINQTITIQASGSDNIQVETIEIYVDDVLQQTCQALECSYNTTLAVGAHTLQAVVTDNSSNTASANTSVQVVDPSASTLGNDLILYYLFNESAGDQVYDYSTNGANHQATIVGGGLWTTVSGEPVWQSQSEVVDYIQIPHHQEIAVADDQDFTIGMYFAYEDTGNYWYKILDKGYYPGFGITVAGWNDDIKFLVSDNAITTDVEGFKDGELHQLVAVYDQSAYTIDVYLDGTLVDTLSYTASQTTQTTRDLLLPSTSSLDFTVSYNRFAVWNRALSASEVADWHTNKDIVLA